MFLKNYFFVLIVSFFVAGFIFFALPNKAFSQAGCCINNGNNCVGCGSNTCCMVEPTGACSGSNGSFTAGQFCCQPSAQAAFCEPNGCCLVDDMCQQSPETECTELSGTYLGDGSCGQFPECEPPPPTGCCDNVPDGDSCRNDVTARDCGTLKGEFTLATSCNFENTCGEPIVVDGCCQTDEDPGMSISIDATCQDTTNVACFDGMGMFTPGGVCDEMSGVCDFGALGCCVFGPNDCDDLTEEGCTLEDGAFKGDGVQCSEVEECNIPPVPPVVVTPIPTLSQWVMIAMAGLLGLLSLFIMIRRHRYNVG